MLFVFINQSDQIRCYLVFLEFLDVCSITRFSSACGAGTCGLSTASHGCTPYIDQLANNSSYPYGAYCPGPYTGTSKTYYCTSE